MWTVTYYLSVIINSTISITLNEIGDRSFRGVDCLIVTEICDSRWCASSRSRLSANGRTVSIINECCIKVSETTCAVVMYDESIVYQNIRRNSPSVQFLLDPTPRNLIIFLPNLGVPIFTYWSGRIKGNSLSVSISAVNSQSPILTPLPRFVCNNRHTLRISLGFTQIFALRCNVSVLLTFKTCGTFAFRWTVRT